MWWLTSRSAEDQEGVVDMNAGRGLRRVDKIVYINLIQLKLLFHLFYLITSRTSRNLPTMKYFVEFVGYVVCTCASSAIQRGNISERLLPTGRDWEQGWSKLLVKTGPCARCCRGGAQAKQAGASCGREIYHHQSDLPKLHLDFRLTDVWSSQIRPFFFSASTTTHTRPHPSPLDHPAATT